MLYEKLGDPFVFDRRSQILQSKLKDHIHSGRRLRCIGQNAASRRYHGRCLRLCVSESKVMGKITASPRSRERIRNNQVVPVVGYDEEGNEWKSKLQEEKKIHSSYIF